MHSWNQTLTLASSLSVNNCILGLICFWKIYKLSICRPPVLRVFWVIWYHAYSHNSLIRYFSITPNLSVDPLCRGCAGLYGTMAPVTIHLSDICSITPNLSVDPLCRGSSGLYGTMPTVTIHLSDIFSITPNLSVDPLC